VLNEAHTMKTYWGVEV